MKHVLHYDQYQPASEAEVQAMIEEMDQVYPEYISDQYKHALD